MIVPDLIKAVESGWEKSRLEGLKIQGKHRMNERIKQLAEQAGWDNHHSKFDTRIEKFAELIVRECAAQVDWILAEGGKTQGDLIREHFYGEEL